jgi:chitodextrinase
MMSVPYRVRLVSVFVVLAVAGFFSCDLLGRGGPPDAPSDLDGYVASASEVHLTWSDNSANEDGFRIEYGINPGEWDDLVQVGPDVEERQVTGLSADTEYHFRIYAWNERGDSSYSSVLILQTATDVDDSPPAPPTDLISSAISSSEISLSWTDNSDNETGFTIYRSLSSLSGYTAVDQVAADIVSYTDDSLVADTTYHYRVRAYNAYGTSDYTQASATTFAAGGDPPADPSGATATAQSSSSILIEWSDNSDNEEGFAIRRSLSSSSDFVEITTVGADVESYEDASLSPGTTYYYRVYAYNGYGMSGYATASATTDDVPDVTAPSVPTDLSATAVSSTQIDLTWTASTDDVGVTGYRVYRDSVYLKEVATTSTSDTELSPSTTYTYTVSAVDAAGNESAQSDEDSATTDDSSDVTAPSVPTDLSATAVSSTQIDLTWTASTDDVGVTGYRVYRDGVYLKEVATTSTSDTELTSSTTYTYIVSAVDAADNESAQSDEASATTDDPPDETPPSVPTGLSATAASSSQINLSWTASTDDVGVTGYRIYRDGVYLKEVATTSTSDTELASSTTYTYTVSAVDAAGNESSQSDEASATTEDPPDETPPSTPTGLSATAASSSQINLSWTASTDNVGVTGYWVYRGGSFLKEVVGTSTSDTGLSANTSYTYAVLAVDAAGNQSGLSTSASATTDPLDYVFNGGTLEDLEAVSPSLVFGSLTINGTLEIPENETSVTLTVSSLTVNSQITVDNDVYIDLAMNSPNVTVNATDGVTINARVDLSGEWGDALYDHSGADGGDFTVNATNIYVNANIDVEGGDGSQYWVTGSLYNGGNGGNGGNITLIATSLLDVAAGGAEMEIRGGEGAYGAGGGADGDDGDDGVVDFEGAMITVDEVSGEFNMLDYNAQVIDYEDGLVISGTTWLGEESDHRNMAHTWAVVYDGPVYDWIEDIYLVDFDEGLVDISITPGNPSADLDIFWVSYPSATILIESNGATGYESLNGGLYSDGKYWLWVSYSDDGGNYTANYTITFD